MQLYLRLDHWNKIESRQNMEKENNKSYPNEIPSNNLLLHYLITTKSQYYYIDI